LLLLSNVHDLDREYRVERDLAQLDLIAGENKDEGDVRLALASSNQEVKLGSASRIAELKQDSTTKVLAVTRQEMQDTGYEAGRRRPE
jgi:hypothetical protein